MATNTTKKPLSPLIIRGRNATGKIILGSIPAGELPTEDPVLAIQKILGRHKGIEPTPIEAQ